MRKPERDAFIFYLTTTNKVTISLGKEVAAAQFSAKWLNPTTAGEMPAGNISGERPQVSLPGGWKDALLVLKK